MDERLAELRELQDAITARRRDDADRHDARPCSSTSRASPAATARRPRSTASSRCPTTCRSAQFAHGAHRRCAWAPTCVAERRRQRGRSTGGVVVPVEPSASRRWANLVTVARRARRAADVLADPRRPQRDRGWRSRCGSCSAAATRSTASWPAATARRRSARSSTRWPTRCSSSARCSRSSAATCSGSCRS